MSKCGVIFKFGLVDPGSRGTRLNSLVGLRKLRAEGAVRKITRRSLDVAIQIENRDARLVGCRFLLTSQTYAYHFVKGWLAHFA